MRRMTPITGFKYYFFLTLFSYYAEDVEEKPKTYLDQNSRIQKIIKLEGYNTLTNPPSETPDVGKYSKLTTGYYTQSELEDSDEDQTKIEEHFATKSQGVKLRDSMDHSSLSKIETPKKTETEPSADLRSSGSLTGLLRVSSARGEADDSIMDWNEEFQVPNTYSLINSATTRNSYSNVSSPFSNNL
jgi:hypothetical protein